MLPFHRTDHYTPHHAERQTTTNTERTKTVQKKIIGIQATMRTFNVLRLFLVDSKAEATHGILDKDCYIDIRIKGKGTAPKKIEALLLSNTRRSSGKSKGNLGEYRKKGMEVLRVRKKNDEVVWAYQALTVTTIVDKRRQFGHLDVTTEESTAEITPLTIIFGERLTRRKAAVLEWTLRQKRTEDVPDTGWYMRNCISANAMDSFEDRSYQESDAGHIIKVGPATFIPFDKKKMKLAFRTEK